MTIYPYPINDDYSIALIKIDGNHGAIKSIKSNRLYFVKQGTGVFIIDGKEHSVVENDVVFVPQNTPYNFIGHMTLVLTSTPAFAPDHDVHLDT